MNKIQKKEIDLNGLENEIADSFSAQLLKYNDTWDKIDCMLDKVMSLSTGISFLILMARELFIIGTALIMWVY